MDPVVHRGITSIRQRLNLIAKRIHISVIKPQTAIDGRQYMLKDFTHFLIRGTPQHGPGSEEDPIEAVFRYVENNIEYRQDPTHYDYYMGAGRIINSRAGDCDDMTILLCSMLDTVGYMTGARVISPDGKSWHIYALVGVEPAHNGQPTDVVPLDAAYGDEPGWEPADRFKKHIIECTFIKGKVVNYRVVRNGGGGILSWFGLTG
jgi:hypothetical protein